MKNKDNFALKQGRKYSRVYLIGFFLILALPLLNLPPLFSPPAWGQTITFRILMSLLILFLLWRFFLKKEGLPNVKYLMKNVSFLALLSLLAIFFLATIFSLDTRFSLWGSPYRSDGIINFVFYVLFAAVLSITLEEKYWKKLLDFCLLIGFFVSIIAIFQQFGFLKNIFISFEARPPSTIGGPTFLAVYLLLLSFLALSLGFETKNFIRKWAYFSLFLIFSIVIFLITQTRSAIIGIGAGALWFFFAYPKKIALLKVSAAVLMILGIVGVYYINRAEHFPAFVEQNKVLKDAFSRLSFEMASDDPRISGWEIAYRALLSRPLLGFGPENFSIGFDKFYDPLLPNVTKAYYETAGWWDRAHNIIFDIGTTAGIFAVITYIALFSIIFWQLQKIKETTPEKSIIVHGLQATFLGYISTNFFSFDTFSTYLMLFFIIGYSFFLVAENLAKKQPENIEGKDKLLPKNSFINKYGKSIFLFSLVILVLFVWNFNIKPLKINEEINVAASESLHGLCEQALAKYENILAKHSILDSYVRLKYIEIIKNCMEDKPNLVFDLAKKAAEALRENTKIRPYYTRNWLLLGYYTNIILEIEESREIVDEVAIKELEKGANEYFKKAIELSPKRQEIMIEWAKTDIITGSFDKATDKARDCIELNSNFGECYWIMGIAKIYSGKERGAEDLFNFSYQKGFNSESETSLLQLQKAYSKVGNYSKLIDIYKKLINLNPNNLQYHATLAFNYREIGDFQKAREEALKVLELSPESKDQVEEFLKTLPL